MTSKTVFRNMDISVIICTYNPDQKIFGRCLDAVQNLDTTGLSVEILVIDNNSIEPLTSRDYVNDFLKKVSNSRIIIEPQQGLTYARMAGFTNSSGELLIFFDDDNEPFSDYLLHAKKLMTERPFIGVLGPGYINVTYTDPVDPWIEKNLGNYFQEKKADREEYILSVMSWAPWYPPGTGQIIRRTVFEAYLQNFSVKGLTISDRKGNDLSSGGDSQIIWSSLNKNLAVGHHPSIRINHLIPGKRANFSYLKRLTYSLELSGNLAFVEMYPEKIKSLPHYKTSAFLLNIFRILFNDVKNRRLKNTPINLSILAGRNQAYLTLFNTPAPFLLRKTKQLLKLS